MIDATGMDCSVHEPTVKTWWLVLLIIYSIQMSYISTIVWEFVKVKGLKGLKASPLQMVLVYSGMHAFLRITEGLVRFLTSGKVGDNWIVSIVAAMAGFLFWGVLIGKFLGQWIGMIGE